MGRNGASAAAYEIYRDIVVHQRRGAYHRTRRYASGSTTAPASLLIRGRSLPVGTVFDPIVLTSVEAALRRRQSGPSVYLGPGADASELTHVWIQYGAGLRIDGCAPAVDALSVLFNAPCGLSLAGESSLVTSNLLAQFNDIGLLQQLDNAQLVLSDSIVVNNGTNALSTGSYDLVAPFVWWGSINEAGSSLRFGWRR